jgi:DNA-binding XRE family transcriptional regulator
MFRRPHTLEVECQVLDMSVEGDQDLLTDMGDSSNSQTMGVAARLKLIREIFGISQRELAKRAGVTNSSISMIELGQVSPSIQSLERILSVIPIGLSDFFGFSSTSSVRVSRSSASLPTTNAISSYPVEGHLTSGIVIVPPGGASALKALTHDFCGVVVEGEAQLKSVTTQELLVHGDSFYVPAGQLHRFVNPGKLTLRLFICSLFVHI